MAVNTNISIKVLCDQRKKQMLFNNPQFRFTPVSPYNGNFTKFQLDMRRKAEILKYSNMSSSSKTNNLTKAQKFAQIIKGNTQKQSFQNKTITILDSSGNYNTITVGYPDKLIISNSTESQPNAVRIIGSTGYFLLTIIPNGLIVNCALDRLIPTPTSSCGIPGPILYLIDDENVPLYNFTNNTINNAAYSDSQNQIITNWETIPFKNILLTTNVSTTVGSMLVKSSVKEPFYTLTLNVPIGVYATNSPGISARATIFINSIYLDVQYSGSSVNTNNYNITLSKNTFNSPIRVQYVELSTPVNGYNYFAYIDTVVVSNIFLITNPGYVYDFYLKVNIDTNNTAYAFANSKIFANFDNTYLSSGLTLSA